MHVAGQDSVCMALGADIGVLCFNPLIKSTPTIFLMLMNVS